MKKREIKVVKKHIEIYNSVELSKDITFKYKISYTPVPFETHIFLISLQAQICYTNSIVRQLVEYTCLYQGENNIKEFNKENIDWEKLKNFLSQFSELKDEIKYNEIFNLIKKQITETIGVTNENL